MKKIFLSMMAFAMMAMTVSAQEAFKSIGVGVEAGLMGFGFQVSVPVVTNHLLVDVGYNFYGLKIGRDFDMSKGTPNEGIAALNEKIDMANQLVTFTDQGGQIDHVPLLQDDITIGAKAAPTGSFKIMAEYYPSATGSFFLKAGLVFGTKKLIKLSGRADDEAQAIYDKARAIQNQLRGVKDLSGKPLIGADEDLLFSKLQYNVDENTYCLDPEDVAVDACVQVEPVRPYLGLGFGRAIPKGRVGFQFELGAWYHGKPTIASPNETRYNPDANGIDGVGKIMSKIQFMPQMTFRLTGRIL